MTNETDRAYSSPPTGYVPQARKPRLWRSTTGQPSVARITAVVIGITVAAFVLLAVYEKDMLGVPLGPVEVVVLGIQRDKPQGRLSPAWFEFAVALPDGSKMILISDRMEAPGTKLIVSMIRGRVSGRLWLRGPYRVATAPSASPD